MEDIKDIFGTHLRSMLEYVGWIKKEAQFKTKAYLDYVPAAHTILSQPIKEEWFVRPEEPKKDNPLDEGMIEYEKWQNWQPMFKGDWEIFNDNMIYQDINGDDYTSTIIKYTVGETYHVFKIISNSDKIMERSGNVWRPIGTTLNDFATHCESKNIPLELK